MVFRVLPVKGQNKTRIGFRRAGYTIQAYTMSEWHRVPISFPESSLPWPAVGKREFWEQPFWNNKGNNRILPIRFHCAVYIYGACLKWLLPELSIPGAGQKDRGVWRQECTACLLLKRMRIEALLYFWYPAVDLIFVDSVDSINIKLVFFLELSWSLGRWNLA